MLQSLIDNVCCSSHCTGPASYFLSGLFLRSQLFLPDKKRTIQLFILLSRIPQYKKLAHHVSRIAVCLMSRHQTEQIRMIKLNYYTKQIQYTQARIPRYILVEVVMYKIVLQYEIV